MHASKDASHNHEQEGHRDFLCDSTAFEDDLRTWVGQPFPVGVREQSPIANPSSSKPEGSHCPEGPEDVEESQGSGPGHASRTQALQEQSGEGCQSEEKGKKMGGRQQLQDWLGWHNVRRLPVRVLIEETDGEEVFAAQLVKVLDDGCSRSQARDED
jgi:hypothetical protein